MVRRIENDHRRFRQIVQGRIRKDLKKYMSQGKMLGRKGKNIVTIPLPQISIPRFKYGSQDTGGVGSGEGEQGKPVGPGEGGEAGEMPGEHELEVEITLEELAKILGEELELPRIEPRGTKKNLKSEVHKYTGIRRAGPESLRHFRRTYREALKRQLAAGEYDPDAPIILPLRDDRRYRAWRTREAPESNAVIIYMMDVSGSMGEEQKEIVRTESFWIDTWLRSQYKAIESRYIVHDAAAREVDQKTFYHLRESGGTKISSAYDLCANIINADYNPTEWNIYPFHFSDGDNWGTDDSKACFALLRKFLLPAVNLFCYGQVKSAYGSGKFKKELDAEFGDDEILVTSDIADREGVFDSIKEFLGKGR